MIRRALRLAKSLIAAALATAALPPSDTKAAARERFEKRAKEAGPGPGFVASHRRPRPTAEVEVARPPVSWWRTAANDEKLEMRRELRKKLGRDPADLQRRFFSRMASLKRLVRQVQTTHERLYARAAGLRQHHMGRPCPPEVARELALLAAEMHELSGELAKYQIRLQHLRVIARRQHKSNAMREAQRRTSTAIENTGGHILGAW